MQCFARFELKCLGPFGTKCDLPTSSSRLLFVQFKSSRTKPKCLSSARDRAEDNDLFAVGALIGDILRNCRQPVSANLIVRPTSSDDPTLMTMRRDADSLPFRAHCLGLPPSNDLDSSRFAANVTKSYRSVPERISRALRSTRTFPAHTSRTFRSQGARHIKYLFPADDRAGIYPRV